jgi:hypothetical protein
VARGIFARLKAKGDDHACAVFEYLTHLFGGDDGAKSADSNEKQVVSPSEDSDVHEKAILIFGISGDSGADRSPQESVDCRLDRPKIGTVSSHHILIVRLLG